MIQAFPPPDQLPVIPNEPEFLTKVVRTLEPRSTEAKILGKVEESCQLATEELVAIQSAVAEGLPLDTDKLSVRRFARLRVNGVTFHSLAWRESQRRQNCIVKFHFRQGHSFGQIESFAQLSDNSRIQKLCAFITLFQCSTPFSSLPLPTYCLYAVKYTATLVVVEATQLLDKCIFIHIGDRYYISEFVDRFEKD